MKHGFLISIIALILLAGGVASWYVLAKDPCASAADLLICYPAQAEKTLKTKWCFKIPDAAPLRVASCIARVAELKDNRRVCDILLTSKKYSNPYYTTECQKDFDAATIK